MDTLADFLERLLGEGRVVFRARPEPRPEDAGRAASVLGRAFEAVRLDLAGPPIPFDPAAAVAAGELLRRACWALVSHEERVEDLARALTMPMAPETPSRHLSADLALRYLPHVHRRARAIDPGDPLRGLLEDVFRRWPLSGVLAEVVDRPLTPPDTLGHPGLWLLFAERLAAHDRPNWRPAGRAAEFAELVGLGGDHG
ncbi:MAG TPA: hypothetical protein VG406_29050 [Isosphaeraceae bacterium]|jgi:hypothetical protein|nr:hypothetical protein [Isosphaeraceae bacterium]